MSTTLSAMTAAELVAELKRNPLRMRKKDAIAANAAITAELDARCGHWGFELTKTEQGHIWSIGKTLIGDRGNHYQCNVFAEQFHALLGYLLTKGGAK